MPVKRLPIHNFYESDENWLDHQIAEWAFDSHYWIETSPACYECQWCRITHIANCIDKYFPLCKENPALQKLMKRVQSKYDELIDNIGLENSEHIDD